MTTNISKSSCCKGLLLYNIRQIVQIVDNDTCFLGNDMKNIKVLTSDDCSLAILCKNGKIAAIERSEKFDFIKEHSITDRLDCGGGCVLPGLVDGHTHPVFAGDRVHEFAMKLAGATYMDVQAAGVASTSPLKKQEKLQKIHLENIDVFCEKNVFEIETSKKILQAGQKIGLKANFHADELHPLGGTELASEIKATAASHLEEISEAGINALADAGTVAVLLPTTAYILRLKPPPARQMIERGVCVALGSDFNPNAFCYSMPTVMNLACVTFKMSMSESLVAATLNAAHSLGRAAHMELYRLEEWQI
uniref:imidazolonepropionase n=1 Tax=Ditylenchus dipsaci TaxID=166011 RepID=A0A915DSC1_9BILA